MNIPGLQTYSALCTWTVSKETQQMKSHSDRFMSMLTVCSDLPLRHSRSGNPVQQTSKGKSHGLPWCDTAFRNQSPGNALNTNSDMVRVSPVIFTDVRPKCEFFCICSKIYDRLGLVTPVTIQLKSLMQNT